LVTKHLQDQRFLKEHLKLRASKKMISRRISML
jgi:hypothetical protein